MQIVEHWHGKFKREKKRLTDMLRKVGSSVLYNKILLNYNYIFDEHQNLVTRMP